MSDLRDLLEQLQSETVKALLDRVRSGEATASDLNVARQLLKDNGVDTIPKKGDPLAQLQDALPDLDANDQMPRH